MDAVHTELYQNIHVNPDPKTSTQGGMTSPVRKLLPTKIRQWEDFEETQFQIWNKMGTADPDFFLKPCFDPRSFLQRFGKYVGSSLISSEKDLCQVTREVIEYPVASILSKISENPRIAKALSLRGSVKFENHGNGLDGNLDEAGDRKLATPTKGPMPDSLTTFAGRSESNSNQSKGYMYADLICVHKWENGQAVPVFIIEYKPPHKLTLDMISVGLLDMDPYNDIVNSVTQEDKFTAYAKFAVAAAITQTFDYMVRSRLQYGYVCTGLAFIFLHIKEDDPTTVYYHLSVPREELSDGTRWQAGSSDPNLLHATALGRVAIFCIQALQSSPLTVEWVIRAQEKLQRWNKNYDEMLQSIPESVPKEARSAPYKVSRPIKQSDLRKSPICLRSRPAATEPQCGPSPYGSSFKDKSNKNSDDKDDNGNDDQDARARGSPHPPARAKKSEPPSKTDARTGSQRSYCTQQCLLGLLQHAQLDEQCPNVDEHRKLDGCRHDITRSTFL